MVLNKNNNFDDFHNIIIVITKYNNSKKIKAKDINQSLTMGQLAASY